MMRRYLVLSKARLSGLVLLTTLVGYLLAATAAPDDGEAARSVRRFLACLVGTGLAAGGANALNQWLERRLDALMERTRHRPLPSGRLTPRQALGWGLVTSGLGVSVLALFCGPLPAGLALGVVVIYTVVYTPLKRRSSFCTLAGAVCGAVPPLIGWAAAAGRLDSPAWILAIVLFVWQIPHFFALGWMHRRDYARARFCMLPVIDTNGQLTFSVLVLFHLVLIPIGLALALVGAAGPVYALGSVALGCIWLAQGLRLYADRSIVNARRVFMGSLLYLPLLLGLMVADRPPASGYADFAPDAESRFDKTVAAQGEWPADSADQTERAPALAPSGGGSP
jgi:protoheme IX farnesyltransferase